MAEIMGVAEAKRRFSELIERVRSGERFVVTRRGRAVVALVPPEEAEDAAEPQRYLGLAAFAGAAEEWEDIDDFVREIYAARRRARDRPAPDLG
jgi:prevent-host-death family protein